MPLKLGLSTLQSVRLGPDRLKRIMVGAKEVWGSWDPYYNQSTLSQQQPPQATWATHATVTAPHDMVARVKFNTNWRGGYENQAIIITVNGNWVAHARTSQSSMTVEKRVFVPSGGVVRFLSYNNTTASLRWIDSGYWEVQSVNDRPQSTDGVFLLTLDRYTNTPIGSFTAHRPMVVNVSITNFSWRQSDSNFTRALGMRINSTLVETSGDEARSLSVTNLSLNKGDVLSFIAWSDSDSTSYREISGGIWNVNIL